MEPSGISLHFWGMSTTDPAVGASRKTAASLLLWLCTSPVGEVALSSTHAFDRLVSRGWSAEMARPVWLAYPTRSRDAHPSWTHRDHSTVQGPLSSYGGCQTRCIRPSSVVSESCGVSSQIGGLPSIPMQAPGVTAASPARFIAVAWKQAVTSASSG